MSSPEAAPDPVESYASILTYNLRAATGFAKHPDNGFAPLIFMGPDGKPALELSGACNDVNRAMLAKLYQISHADVDAVKTVDIGTPDDPRYVRRTTIPTSHGFQYLEQYTKQVMSEDAADWEHFQVTAIGDSTVERLGL